MARFGLRFTAGVWLRLGWWAREGSLAEVPGACVGGRPAMWRHVDRGAWTDVWRSYQ